MDTSAVRSLPWRAPGHSAPRETLTGQGTGRSGRRRDTRPA